MMGLYIIAREQGKYEAIGGHRASTGFRFNDKGQYLCTVCGTALTRNGDRHIGRRRRKRVTK